jgi:hypothetical protein
VVVFGLDGSFMRQWGAKGIGEGQFDCPSFVVVRGEEVLVNDFTNHRVQVFGLDGLYKRQWSGQGDEAGQFQNPKRIAVSEGEVFVSSNHRVQVFR